MPDKAFGSPGNVHEVNLESNLKETPRSNVRLHTGRSGQSVNSTATDVDGTTTTLTWVLDVMMGYGHFRGKCCMLLRPRSARRR